MWLFKKGTGQAPVEKRTVIYGMYQEQSITEIDIIYDLEGSSDEKNVMIKYGSERDMGNRYKLLKGDVRQEIEYRIGGNDNMIVKSLPE